VQAHIRRRLVRVGWAQFGYRYALDFMPFVWLLIVLALRQRQLSIEHPNRALALIVIGVVVNLWGAYWLPDLRDVALNPADGHVAPYPAGALVASNSGVSLTLAPTARLGE
jgi:hypothetical protein